MHIAFFNRSFYPDDTATGQLLTELCETLVAAYGCRVSVVTGRPRGLPARETYRGIEILRAWGTQWSKRRVIGRLSNYVTYFLSACVAGLQLDRPDVVMALTDPPIIGLAAWLTARRYHIPWIISYRDIFPEVGRLLKEVRSEPVFWLLEQVNRFLVRRADRVVALGATMRQRLIEEKGADPAKTVIIEDWADCTQIVPGPKRNAFSLAQGLADRFVVMHSGNLGLSQGLELLVEAAGRLQAVPEILVVFIGEGVKKPSLEARVRALGVTNVRFLPYQPKPALTDAFASADLFVISLERGLAGYIVPSKLYGILAAGRPYVAAVEEACEVTAITRHYQCGLLAEPGHPDDLADKILTLYRDRALAQRMGERARQAALAFDRPRGVRAYDDLCREVLHARRAR